MEYSAVVVAHMDSPRNMGEVADANVHARAGGLRAGPFIAFSARVHDGTIEEIKFETYSCPVAVAVGSFLTTAVCGKTLESAGRWNVELLLAALGGLPRAKHHLVHLAIEALGSVIREAADPGLYLRNSE